MRKKTTTKRRKTTTKKRKTKARKTDPNPRKRFSEKVILLGMLLVILFVMPGTTMIK